MFLKGKKSLMMFIATLLFVMMATPFSVSASIVTNPTDQTTTQTLDNEQVSVNTVNQNVNIKKTILTLKKKKKAKLKVKLTNVSKKDLIFQSSNPKVVSVNSKGILKAKKGGTVTITVTIRGTQISDSIKVTCKDYYTMRVKTTGYCNGACCCGGWAGQNTASGKRPRANHTIAVDRRVIPLGTKVQIGKRIYVAEDTGVRGRTIDVYYGNHRAASRHGVRYTTVKVFF
ncbi:MAG: 3D domain-containing protein [Eubacteriales bacterium]|nr:3D domain-containing protein [Eubacteriales bacterium]